MTDDVLALLKVHAYFRDVSDETLADVVREGWVTQHAAGEVVHEANELLSAVGFVLRGRIKAVRVDDRGTESLFRMIERGEQFGLMIGALSEPVSIRAVALEPTTLLRLDFEKSIDLTFRFPELRRLWLTTFAGNLKKHFFGTSARRAPSVVALIHESPGTRRASDRLIDRLRDVGENLAVLGDVGEGREIPGIRFRPVRSDGVLLDVTEVRRQVAAWQDADRIVFDFHTYPSPDWVGRVMELADRVILFAAAGDAATVVNRLRSLDVGARGWRDKLRVAWLLGPGDPVGPATDVREWVARDFKLTESPAVHPWGRAASAGLERLVHDLRNVRIGVALGGGGARGMAHLGVLKVLEENGIVVDAIAGTSAGALTGVVYASGLAPDYSAARFGNDLTPTWFFRRLPRGNHWYLLDRYRRGRFDPMLRKYLRDYRLEQLAVPSMSVTVDLVSGKPMVRDRGDAVHAVLESINIPVLSPPICRSGQALVDGGLVNNVPADVLVQSGCNFVIAVSVTAKMEAAFWKMTSGSAATPRKRPSILPTLLRSLLVQNHSLNAIGVQPADVVIQPDVTGFDLTEFMRARELSTAGEAATRDHVAKIQHLLSRLDPQLFRFPK
jgi:predicted acylesterase/phospholipase RssA/CRP-like cAMP-binding protein